MRRGEGPDAAASERLAAFELQAEYQEWRRQHGRPGPEEVLARLLEIEELGARRDLETEARCLRLLADLGLRLHYY